MRLFRKKEPEERREARDTVPEALHERPDLEVLLPSELEGHHFDITSATYSTVSADDPELAADLLAFATYFDLVARLGDVAIAWARPVTYDEWTAVEGFQLRHFPGVTAEQLRESWEGGEAVVGHTPVDEIDLIELQGGDDVPRVHLFFAPENMFWIFAGGDTAWLAAAARWLAASLGR